MWRRAKTQTNKHNIQSSLKLPAEKQLKMMRPHSRRDLALKVSLLFLFLDYQEFTAFS